MTYAKQTWVNAPTTSSPLVAARLNHMEDGIDAADVAAAAAMADAETKYTKPGGGIPKNDLVAAVQASLTRADLAFTSVTKSDVGLGNADNTADVDKPVSTAQQAALNLKAPLASPTFTGTVAGVTKTMVGLGSVDNTADTSKPVSTAQQAALDGKLSAASNLSDVGNATTARSNLGLVIGTNVEAHDADLTTFAGLSPANDDILQRKAGAWANRTMAQLKSDLVLAKADVGLGNVDNTSNATERAATATLGSKTLVNPTITNYTESVVPIGNSSTSKTLDLTNGTMQTVTLTGSCTFTMPAAVAGKSFTLLVNTGAGSFTATFTGVKWQAGVAPTVTASAARLDVFTFVSDGTNWYGSVQQNYTP